MISLGRERSLRTSLTALTLLLPAYSSSRLCRQSRPSRDVSSLLSSESCTSCVRHSSPLSDDRQLLPMSRRCREPAMPAKALEAPAAPGSPSAPRAAPALPRPAAARCTREATCSSALWSASGPIDCAYQSSPMSSSSSKPSSSSVWLSPSSGCAGLRGRNAVTCSPWWAAESPRCQTAARSERPSATPDPCVLSRCRSAWAVARSAARWPFESPMWRLWRAWSRSSGTPAPSSLSAHTTTAVRACSSSVKATTTACAWCGWPNLSNSSWVEAANRCRCIA
mmetsp:Transcript_10711/g.41585  ORF Transcript_10711/g.41585 Transcript_10711/m.41585 type:complete len:281 (-) Transcript_10711:87-929(-)